MYAREAQGMQVTALSPGQVERSAMGSDPFNTQGLQNEARRKAGLLLLVPGVCRAKRMMECRDQAVFAFFVPFSCAAAASAFRRAIFSVALRLRWASARWFCAIVP